MCSWQIGPFPCREKDAAALVRTIVSVVAHCHLLGVVHRYACLLASPEDRLKKDSHVSTEACACLIQQYVSLGQSQHAKA